MRFTLRQLEVFLAVAHSSNLTRAAGQLNMSQSAASSSLKDLENQFDVLLFDRVGKRLQLSEQGRLLRPKAEALMAVAEDLEQSMLRHATAGPLNVGATLSIGNYLAVGMVADYMTLYPGSPVKLDVENTEHITEKVLNFRLDIGLIEGEFHHPELEVMPWRRDEMAIVCHPSHPLAQLQTVRGDDLTRARWILREAGSGTRQAFDRAMQGFLPQINIALELQHTEAIKRAVEANLGIACLSMITLEDELRRGDLVCLNTPDLNLSRQLYLIVHKQKHRSAGIQAWIRLCMESGQ
ncbi:MAG TPA: LysR family transcriptional regulator [Oceanospirillales bacterium]|nr:LysR family transcriptional regulator [Oceanospirillaceae bacterium]HBS41041.1 LysR family transcriptional regulator [Oceanospirillales bacterium]|tara:strand:+ start:322 stop:1206 length:885 start_codon:yes stop_codon:yes gene_type:complete